MARYGMNDIRIGAKVLVDGEPCIVVGVDSITPGRRMAVTRLRFRDLKTDRILESSLKRTDWLEAADVVDVDMTFLHRGGNIWYFMQSDTFEQIEVGERVMTGAARWLKGGETCVVTLWKEEVLAVVPPNFVELAIVETDPGVRGDTASGSGKPAKLGTGAIVRVPLFVARGERIRVDTRTGEYVGRRSAR